MKEEKPAILAPHGAKGSIRTGFRSPLPGIRIHGGGAQIIAWPAGFIAEMVSRGRQPIRFDNGDPGFSSPVNHTPTEPRGRIQRVVLLRCPIRFSTGVPIQLSAPTRWSLRTYTLWALPGGMIVTPLPSNTDGRGAP
jgi:hypothetical protein